MSSAAVAGAGSSIFIAIGSAVAGAALAGVTLVGVVSSQTAAPDTNPVNAEQPAINYGG